MSKKFTVQPSRNVCAASRKNYGGAFDIDPEMFFTRDDLDQLNEAVLDHISETFSGNYQISDSWIGGDDNQQVHVEVDDVDAGVTHFADVHVDMRKIHKPSDLRDKYALQLAAQIIEAIKEYQNIYSSTEAVTGGFTRYDDWNLPGPGDYDPPEYDEGRELDPEVDTVECTLDAIIIVSEDNDYEYEDKSYKWAAGYSRNGDWESNIYTGLTLCSKIDVVENVDEMLMDILDYTPGRYHIQGEVTLKFDIDGAVAYSNNAKYEEDYEEIIEVDSSDVTYNKKESYIEGFIQEPVIS